MSFGSSSQVPSPATLRKSDGASKVGYRAGVSVGGYLDNQQVPDYATLRTNLAAGVYVAGDVVEVTDQFFRGSGVVETIGSYVDDGGHTITGGSFAWIRTQSAASEGDARNFGMVADASTDDRVPIANDLQKYKKFVMPPNATAYISDRIGVDLTSGMQIVGSGQTSVIETDQDIEMFKTTSAAEYVLFDTICLRKNQAPTSTKFHIVGVNSVGLTVRNCWLYGPVGFQYAGVGISDGVNNPEDPNCAASGFTTQILHTQITQGCIAITHTDSKIFGGFVWANEAVANSDFAILMQAGANSRIVGVDLIPALNGGIVLNDYDQLTVDDCFFDGNNNVAIESGVGIYNKGSTANIHTNIVNNTFWRLFKGGIDLPNNNYTNIRGNVFLNCNKGNNGSYHDIHLRNQLLGLGNNIVTGNNHLNNVSTVKAKALLVNESTFEVRGDFTGNSAAGSGYDETSTPKIQLPDTDEKHDSRRNQYDSRFSFRNGDATITSGNNIVSIVWSALPKTPQYKYLRVTPPRNQAPTFRISGLTSTGFNIITSGTVASDTDFSFEYAE